MKRMFYILTTLFLTLFLLGSGTNGFSAITFTSPDPAGTTRFVKGTTESVTWAETADIGVIVLKLYKTDGGAFISEIGAPQGSLGLYSWAVPNATASGAYFIKAFLNADNSLLGTSESFNIVVSDAPYITIGAPTGATSWQRGVTHEITWTDNIPTNVRVDLCSEDYSVIGNLKPSTSANISPWYIAMAYEGPYRIKITDLANTNYAVYSQVFNVTKTNGTVITVQPVAAQMQKGESYDIAWTATNCLENLIIQLKKSDGTLSTIKKSIAYDGTNHTFTYTWTIPATTTPEAGYKIKITSLLDDTKFDESDPFEITAGGAAGTITCTYPTPGLTFQRGKALTTPISWTKTIPDDENVRVTLVRNSDLLETELAPSIGIVNSLNWFIAGDLTPGVYHINLYSVKDAGITTSSPNFTIASGSSGTISSITAPTTGANWKRGKLQTISWVREAGFTDNVKVELCDATGVPVPGGIIKMSTSLNSVNWFIAPSAAVGDYQIKVTSLLNASKTITTGTFHIVASELGVIDITTQTTNEVYAIGGKTTHAIAWTQTPNDPKENVRIELLKGGVKVRTLKKSTHYSPFNWYVTPDLGEGNDYQIKVVSVLDDTKFDVSHEFSLALFKMSVFPNPANNNLTLDLGDSSTGTYDVVMYDRFGTQRMQTSLNADVDKQKSISVSNLPNGIYYIVLTAGETRITRTVVVQH